MLYLVVFNYPKLPKHITFSFLGGISWALGASVGFALFIWVLTGVLGTLGGLPVVGQFFATIVETTNQALEKGAK